MTTITKKSAISLAIVAACAFLAAPAFAARMQLPDGSIKTCAGVGTDSSGNYVCRNGGSFETLPAGTKQVGKVQRTDNIKKLKQEQ